MRAWREFAKGAIIRLFAVKLLKCQHVAENVAICSIHHFRDRLVRREAAAAHVGQDAGKRLPIAVDEEAAIVQYNRGDVAISQHAEECGATCQRAHGGLLVVAAHLQHHHRSRVVGEVTDSHACCFR